VLTGNNSLALKKRALFVLALSEDPRAHDLLVQYAKGSGTPDLQVEAIRYLVSRDRQAMAPELKSIYASTTDQDVRRAVISAYRDAGDKASLLAIASSRSDAPELRRTAVGSLRGLATAQELSSLYTQEPDTSVRSQILSDLSSIGAADQLVNVARAEKDPDLRRRAIMGLAERSDDRTMSRLTELYGSLTDVDARRAIIDTLASRNAGEQLVALARKESNRELQRDIVVRLSGMASKNKAAADFLADMLK
jgi:hypothetical protein